MMAPCGIEIKVGQVWRASRGFLKRGGKYRIVAVKKTVAVAESLTQYGAYSMRKEYFTNKRGGYKLVKEAE